MFDDIIGKSNENEVTCVEDPSCSICQPRSLTDVIMEYAQFLDDPILKLGLINALSRDINNFLYGVCGMYVSDDARSSLAENTINILTGCTTRLTLPSSQLLANNLVPTAAGSTMPAHNHSHGNSVPTNNTPINSKPKRP